MLILNKEKTKVIQNLTLLLKHLNRINPIKIVTIKIASIIFIIKISCLLLSELKLDTAPINRFLIPEIIVIMKIP